MTRSEMTKDLSARPLVVGFGGTLRASSSSELALRMALEEARRAGAETRMFTGADVDFPTFNPDSPERCEKSKVFLEAIRQADGIIISSPAYHGSVPGYLKNAIDYVEDLRADARPYFEGRAVGCMVCAAGWQAVGPTLGTMRSIVHALRGWPTPLAIGVNSIETRFGADGTCTSEKDAAAIGIMARQVLDFSRMTAGLSETTGQAA